MRLWISFVNVAFLLTVTAMAQTPAPKAPADPWAKFPPKPGEKVGTTHEDLVYIYPAQGAAPFRAIYFDSEGHVIQYAASFPQKPNAVVLESETGQPGPRYRLEYELNADGTLKNVFSIAPPG